MEYQLVLVVVVFTLGVAFTVFITRPIMLWFFKIFEVVKLLKEILEELKKFNDQN